MTLEEFRQVLVENVDYAENQLPQSEQFMWYRTGLACALNLLDDCILNTLGVDNDNN